MPIRYEGTQHTLRNVFNGDEEPLNDVGVVAYATPRRADHALAHTLTLLL